jgi:hypothetical protein
MPQSVVFLSIASLLSTEEVREISTHFLISFSGLKSREWDPWEKGTAKLRASEWCSQARGGHLRDIGPLRRPSRCCSL